jgi:hypothetical protein
MADIDWGLVAVIIALLAYPIQVLAIPSFLPFFQHLIRLLPLPGTYCESFPLDSLRDKSLHFHDPVQRTCYEPGCATLEAFIKRIKSG